MKLKLASQKLSNYSAKLFLNYLNLSGLI